MFTKDKNVIIAVSNNKNLFDRNKIDWSELECYGLTKDEFGKSKVFEKMLESGKSPNLYPVTIKKDDGNYLQGFPRLSFVRKLDGKIGLDLHFPQDLSDTFNVPFYGYTFSKEEQKILRDTGNLGKVIDLTHPYNGSVYPCFISLDSITNHLIAMETKYLKIPDTIYGVKIEDGQKTFLKTGKIIRLEDMQSEKGNLFSGFVQVNANISGLEVTNDYDVRIRELLCNNLNIPTHFKGQEISIRDREQLFEGKIVRMSGKNGESPVYVCMNFFTGKAEYMSCKFGDNIQKPLSKRHITNLNYKSVNIRSKNESGHSRKTQRSA
ncbi:DUF3945 domain-containing protein [Proteiniphilum sp. UBA5346]|uniref:DUF3945 domain-containing protein n=1 Tax=Proteiniphilum sp. UBA5346 TaxID=1947277 RepID=UPI00257FA342|nr:DUF3945 domain-containing protein [Proteiniphilum sp. UBA5346]